MVLACLQIRLMPVLATMELALDRMAVKAIAAAAPIATRTIHHGLKASAIIALMDE